MARDYGTRRTTRQKNRAPHQFLVISVTFLLGYLTASVLDVETVSHWLNTQVLESHQAKPEPIKKTPQTAELPPKPKFEFYTLLANEKGAGATQTQTNKATNPAAVTATTGTSVAAATIPATKPNTSISQQPAVVKVAEGKPLTPTHGSKRAYLVQVAAFKARQDAEHMKGLLILKGFDVNVVPVTNARGNWFRVVVGPYSNRILAQQARGTIAKTERLRGVVTPVSG